MIDFGFVTRLFPITGRGAYFNNPSHKMLEWRNDFRIWKWCRQNDLLTTKHHEKWCDKVANDNTLSMYLISDFTEYSDEELEKMDLEHDSDDLNNFVGVCGLTDIDRVNQRAEFSLYIAPDHQRKGLATAALKTLLSHGFLNQNLNVIWGETFDGNPAYEMFLNLGMKHEGTRRQFYFKEGKHIDAHLVSMTRTEFEEVPWKSVQR